VLEEIFEEVRSQMEGALDSLRRDFGAIRTGRASTAILDAIRIDYYGSATPLNQVAMISVPEPRMLVVKPYEQNLIQVIEKAIIADANLGLNPSNDGTIIRLPIPELTEERRREMTKIARHRAEDARVSVRHARRDGIDLADQLKKDGDVSEDEARAAHERIQSLTGEFINKIDEVTKAKEVEIMEV